MLNKTIMGDACPSAYIAKNKQRIKQFNGDIFLNDKDEFQVELFNPTKFKVLAKIEMNLSSIGNGIVLRPGERVFLERHINEPKKFIFETYKVGGSDKEVLEAIENNGFISVKFYKELIYAQPNWYNPTYLYYDGGTNFNHLVGNSITTSSLTNLIGSTTTNTVHFNSSGKFNNTTLNHNTNTKTLNKEIETGRIEKGGSSKQKFSVDSSNFESCYSWKSEWNLLPQSRKEITSEDLLVYCTKCGKKQKKGELYCSNDGTKF